MIPVFLSDLIEKLGGLPGQYGEKQAKLAQEISPAAFPLY
jgi:hypothetical protein